MLTTSLIHCIEGKPNHKFELESKMYLLSLARLAPELYRDLEINILQPTDRDINRFGLDTFKDYKVEFTRQPNLNTVQINRDSNYLNKPITCDYFSQNLDTDMICWLDFDVVFLKDNTSLFRDTDNIVCTIWKDHDYERESMDTYIGIEDIYYEIRSRIPDRFYKPRDFTVFCNSWFIYGPRQHEFWSKWKDYSCELVKVLHTMYPNQISTGIENLAEELAFSCLYLESPNRFIDVRDFFGRNVLAYRENGHFLSEDMIYTEETVLFHYDELGAIYEKGFNNQESSNQILKLILETYSTQELRDLYGMNVKDIVRCFRSLTC